MHRLSDALVRSVFVAGVAFVGASPRGAFADPPATGQAPKVLAVAVGTLGQIDPARMLTVQDERMVLACFEGLTTLDPVTGKAVPAAAESWTTSPDGKVWTFKLRSIKWARQFGKNVESKEEVTAGDFVAAWNRLLDPDTRSPNAHMLDCIPDAKVLASESVRGAALDKLANEVMLRVTKDWKTLKGEDVIEFLTDDGLEARRWMSSIADPAVREFLGWKDADTPYQGVKAKKLVDVLRAESKKSVAATAEAKAHLGIDRGYFAKDDKTLVVQVPGLSPWLPALLARGPLVALRASWLETQRDSYFREGRIFCNGPFVAACDLCVRMSGDPDKNLFKLIYHKNPNHWNAASLPFDQVLCYVNEVWDEVLRKYEKGDIHWISSTALLNPDDYARLLASKLPGFKPKDKVKDKEGARKDEGFVKIAGDTFEAPGGGVCFVRIRCTPPFDKTETRRALASLIKPDELVKQWTMGLAPTTRRFVQPRVAGATATIRLPTFDPGVARKLYGDKKRLVDDWISISCESPESSVAAAIKKSWEAAKIPDEATVDVPEELRKRIDSGLWHLAIATWQPATDDPLALLTAFTTGNAVGGTMWSHATYDALVRAAVDVGGFVAAPDPVLKDVASLKAPLAAATASNLASLETLRQALLAEAESILLEEAVVVPLWTTLDRGLAKKSVRGLPKGDRIRSVLDVTPLQSIRFD